MSAAPRPQSMPSASISASNGSFGQALHHHRLTVGIDRGDRWTTNQVAGELKSGRKVGGCHERFRLKVSRALMTNNTGCCKNGGYLKAKRRPEGRRLMLSKCYLVTISAAVTPSQAQSPPPVSATKTGTP